MKGDVCELPLKNMLVLPFNFDHAVRAGKMIDEVNEENASVVLLSHHAP